MTREVGIEAPIERIVGIGGGGVRDPATEAHVVELALRGAEARFDVAKAFAKGQLCKSQTQELIEAGKAAEVAVAAIARYTLAELVGREMIHSGRGRKLRRKLKSQKTPTVD